MTPTHVFVAMTRSRRSSRCLIEPSHRQLRLWRLWQGHAAEPEERAAPRAPSRRRGLRGAAGRAQATISARSAHKLVKTPNKTHKTPKTQREMRARGISLPWLFGLVCVVHAHLKIWFVCERLAPIPMRGIHGRSLIAHLAEEIAVPPPKPVPGHRSASLSHLVAADGELADSRCRLANGWITLAFLVGRNVS
jgi:hypothetical protein